MGAKGERKTERLLVNERMRVSKSSLPLMILQKPLSDLSFLAASAADAQSLRREQEPRAQSPGLPDLLLIAGKRSSPAIICARKGDREREKDQFTSASSSDERRDERGMRG